jgi:hypothetical protein
MDKNEQKIEGSENPSAKSDKENQKEMGYSSVFGEYKSEEGKNENKEKSTINQPSENKVNEPATSFNSGTSAFSSPNDNKENKDIKVDDGLKSTTNQPVEGSTGYNSMEGEYSSAKIGNTEPKEGASSAGNPQIPNVGLQSTVGQPIGAKTNVSTSTYNSATGAYSSSSSSNNQIKNTNETQTQPVITPLIIQVPSNAPIINNNVIPIGNIQGSVTMTSTTTTTTTTTKTAGITQIQHPNINQQMPFGQPQPLEGSTFAEYPQTVSHGIKSSNIPSADNQPK